MLLMFQITGTPTIRYVPVIWLQLRTVVLQNTKIKNMKKYKK